MSNTFLTPGQQFMYNKIQYLFTAIGFPPTGTGPYTCTQKARTVTCIRKNNVYHRTHKIESRMLEYDRYVS
jgi:hypothetical protein